MPGLCQPTHSTSAETRLRKKNGCLRTKVSGNIHFIKLPVQVSFKEIFTIFSFQFYAVLLQSSQQYRFAH